MWHASKLSAMLSSRMTLVRRRWHIFRTFFTRACLGRSVARKPSGDEGLGCIGFRVSGPWSGDGKPILTELHIMGSAILIYLLGDMFESFLFGEVLRGFYDEFVHRSLPNLAVLAQSGARRNHAWSSQVATVMK